MALGGVPLNRKLSNLFVKLQILITLCVHLTKRLSRRVTSTFVLSLLLGQGRGWFIYGIHSYNVQSFRNGLRMVITVAMIA